MDRLILPSALESCERVLVAGAGGGFDVFAGLPIYHRLRTIGKQVWLANLSFADLGLSDAPVLAPALYEVSARTNSIDPYFPERTLARFLVRHFGEEPPIYAFSNTGVRPIRKAYEALQGRLDFDAVVLVDGGTDILMRGDESGLGTPAEDMASLAAVSGLDLRAKLVACVAFGVDTYSGVCHVNWLQNVAALAVEGGFLGSISLLASMPEVQFYLDAVLTAERGAMGRESVVNACLASAIEGHFGNYHRTRRTSGSTLFISPLMSLLWMFDLDSVVRQNFYLDRLVDTESHWDVLQAIAKFHHSVEHRTAVPVRL